MNIRGCHLISEPVGSSVAVGQTDGFETTVWFKWPNWEINDFTALAQPVKLGAFGTVNEAVKFAHAYDPRASAETVSLVSPAIPPVAAADVSAPVSETVPEIKLP